jgi:Glycosyl hydrolases family 2, sugar binding domain/Glycosyl hydrolases family 2, TIM barrel domain
MSRAGSAAEPPGSGGGGGGEKLLPRSDTADYGKVSRAMQLFGPRLVRSGAPYLSPNWIRRPFRRAGEEDPPKMDAVVHPVHDLVLSRILSWIAPSHVAPLAIKYAVVACWIVLVGFCASGFVLYKNSRIVAVLCETKFVKALASNPHYILNPKHVLVGTVVAMTIAALGAWTYRYRRVLRLAIDKWRFAATSDRPSLSWMEDPTVPAVNRLAMHVPLRLFDSEEMARHAAPVPRLVHSRENNGNASKTSQRVNITTPNVRLLDDHVWHFRLYENPSTAMEAVLHRSASIPDEDSSLWSMIAVPSNWTRQGHDRPIYTNIKYPFPCEPPLAPVDNPTGVYRTTVRVPPKSVTDGSEVTILFHGVESALYVFWNRSFVGFSKDSRLEAEFDVTPYVNAKGDDHDGDHNELVVVVPRFCDGSYVEDQDHWWMAGIYRSVELVTRPRMATMLDYQVRSDQHGAFTCRVECSAVVGTHYHVTAKLYDDRSLSADGDQLILGECVWTGTLPVESHSYHHPENVPPGDSGTSLSPSDTWHGCYFSAEIDKKVLKRWTAETPNLYTLTLTLTVASGEQHRQGGGVRPAVAKVVQAESCRVGFRTVLIEDGQVRVNGRPITVCGMNRHEHDPDHGKTVSLESMKRDICLLKYATHLCSYAAASWQSLRPTFAALWLTLLFCCYGQAEQFQFSPDVPLPEPCLVLPPLRFLRAVRVRRSQH